MASLFNDDYNIAVAIINLDYDLVASVQFYTAILHKCVGEMWAKYKLSKHRKYHRNEQQRSQFVYLQTESMKPTIRKQIR